MRIEDRAHHGRGLRLAMLICAVCVVANGVAVYLLYDTALEEARARLTETVKTHARLIEAVARFDQAHSGDDVHGGAMAATLS